MALVGKLSVETPTDWGQPPVDPQSVAYRQLDVVNEADVHYSASPRPPGHPDCAAAVRGFDHYHRSTQGWACLGYSRVICPHGTVFLGRPLNVVPAAAKDHNTPIVAYCLIADEGEAATPAQWRALLAMARRDALRVGNPLKWTTHREVWPYTECPGDKIQAQVEAERETSPRVELRVSTDLVPRRARAAADLADALNTRRRPLKRASRRAVRALIRAGRKALRRG